MGSEAAGVADEMLGIFGHQLGEAVVAQSRPFRRVLRPGEAVERRHAEADDLAVVRKGLDHAQPLLDVVERGNSPHPLAEILLSRRRLQHQLVDALGKEMIECIDVAHVCDLRLS